MAAFPLFIVLLVLFLFGEMTQNVITRTELLPLPSATFMVEEGPSHGQGVGLSWVGPWAQHRHWHGLPGFIPPTIASQNPAVWLLGRGGRFWWRWAYVMACQVLYFINVGASSFAWGTFLVVRHSFSLPTPRSCRFGTQGVLSLRSLYEATQIQRLKTALGIKRDLFRLKFFLEICTD